MMRTSITKLARPAMLSRTFATTARVMAAGDTGAPPKTGGQGCVLPLQFTDILTFLRGWEGFGLGSGRSHISEAGRTSTS